MIALDLFAGACGGWSLGLHRAGIETMAACEIDPWRQQAFLSNFPSVRMYDDVRDLTAARLLADLGELPSVIVGSPPCQDASVANQRGKGLDGERTGLFFEAIRIVRECQPVWACFENVAGLRARGVERVIVGLEEAGYAVWPLVVGAVHAGAPHRRNRVWIVAAHAAGSGRGRAPGPAPEDWRGGSGQSRSDQGGELARRPKGLCGGGPAAYAASQRLEILGLDARDDGEEQPATERDSAGLWHSWNGGFTGRSGRMDDGLPRGMARASLAAFGDAVVPQITEAIARTMRRLTA